MGEKVSRSIDFQSLVETHEQPFLIIDGEYRIVAVNEAYQRAYDMGADKIIGKLCYELTHGNDRPCFEYGEDCPHRRIIHEKESQCLCTHIHLDGDKGDRHVRIKAYRLCGVEGEMYLGESIELIPEATRVTDPVRMTGSSQAFQHLLGQLKRAALSDAPVLLEGETGTGKDLAARFIHQQSRRNGKPFLTVDCTVFTEPLFEAEVFGHARGAFTGSVGERAGLFEAADGGTLFLDEIGEISATLQAKLLRVIETGDFRRVGSNRNRHTNTRIICATNRRLGRDVDAKQFREDLYYRVACIHIGMPSLRERSEDVPVLAEALLRRIGSLTGQRFTLSDSALAELKRYHYPGNIRELRNILSAAASWSPDGKIDRDKIAQIVDNLQSRRDGVTENENESVSPPSSRPAAPQQSAEPGQLSTLEEIELRHIQSLLRRCTSRRELAAALGISERSVYRKLKQYGLR
jgi:transcriptional regulator with PAS, ATPase and Fis domain